MSRISAADAVVAIKDWGVEFRPRGDNWASFTTAGGWDPVGIAHHHTGGSGALLEPGWNPSKEAMARLLRIGRSDLDGPLAPLAPVFVGKGKRVVLGIGWGNCNHAGTIDNDVARALRAGSFTGGGRGGLETVDGNAILYGLEYMHPGTSAPWPDELLDAGHRTAAALCEAHGWKRDHWAGSNAEHRELTTRKVDRSWAGNGDGMRRAIAALAETSREPDGWLRIDPVQDAVDRLVVAAKRKDAEGRKHQAAYLRRQAAELRERFPVKP
jgi:hypothetical protein